jgi:hypothetical protein
LRIGTAEIGPLGTIPATAAMTTTTTMHSETILTTIALVVAVRAGILLRLSAATSDERR